MMDYGHTVTDEELKKLEKKLAKEYNQAYKEMQAKAQAYFDTFKKQDAEKLRLLNANKITEAEYLKWRQSKMLTGERYNELVETLAKDLTNTNQIAMSMLSDNVKDAYALNRNFAGYEIARGLNENISWDLVDHNTVERLIKENPKLLPKPRVDIPRDMRWNQQKIRSAITQGILQGESIDKIAGRLKSVTDMSDNAAVRNARTATTGAENAGRQDGYDEAVQMGIDLKKKWISTLDSRTRETHILLDGEEVPNDEAFSNRLMYPGDPNGEPEEVYNCRCTMIAVIGKHKYDESHRANKLGNMTYEEWKQSHEPKISEPEFKQYSTLDIVNPTRPHREDFENEDEYYSARNQYREEREIYNQQIDEVVNEALEYKRFESKEDIIKWADSQGITVNSEVLDNVDIRAFNETSIALDEMFKRFPEVKDFSMEYFDGTMFNRDFRIGSTDDGLLSANGGFNFNLRYFKDYEYGLRDAFGGQTNGYFVKGDGTFSSLVRHEYGHNVDEYIQQKISMKYHHMVQDWRKNFDTLDEWKQADKAYWNEIFTYKKELRSLAGLKGTSEYSNTNELELFAEGFAEYTSGSKSEFAKAFGNFLGRWY